MKICKQCGAALEDSALFCEECGAPQGETDSAEASTLEQTSTQDSSLKNKPPVPSEVTPEAITAHDAPSPTDVAQHQVHTVEQSSAAKLSETCTPAKREIKNWVVALILFLCSPFVLSKLPIDFLPFLLCLVVYYGLQIFAIVIMWRKRLWPKWLKVTILVIYVILNFTV